MPSGKSTNQCHFLRYDQSVLVGSVSIREFILILHIYVRQRGQLHREAHFGPQPAPVSRKVNGMVLSGPISE